MDISIQKLAHLARIEMTPSEMKTLEGELSAILAYVSDLSGVVVPPGLETSGMSSTLINVTREDVDADPSGMYTESLLEEAPRVKDGAILVRQVIDR